MGLAETLEKMGGKKPTDEELRRIYTVANALGVSDNDVFLSLIAALDHYYGMYTRIPASITAASTEAAKNAKTEAMAGIAAMAAEQKKMLAAAVYASAEKAAAAASGKALVRWIVGGTIVGMLMLCGAGYIGYTQGSRIGYADARDEALHMRKRDEWATTSSYARAYLYYQTGLLDSILRCERDGWYVKEGVCYPVEHTKGGQRYTGGWKMP